MTRSQDIVQEWCTNFSGARVTHEGPVQARSVTLQPRSGSPAAQTTRGSDPTTA